MSPTHIIIFGFLFIILVGALLLTLPISSHNRSFTSPLTALFTATSATCVTGLVTVDTGLYWSGFGKCVILLLIQIGGLGFMSLAMIFSVLLRRRVSPKERLVFVQSMNLNSADRLITFAKRVIIFAFSAEGAGALLLSFRFIPQFGFFKGAVYSVFHSVSAFCNAGFDLLGSDFGPFEGMIPFADDLYVNIVIAVLIIAGGIGFIVWDDIFRYFKEKKRLSLYTKLVLAVTAFLIVAGTVFFAVSEWNNPGTLGRSATASGKLLRAFFQSVTLRTAGFSTVPQGALTEGSKLFSLLFMFIGGSSGSTAGGIKTVTFAIVFIATLNIIRGNREVNIHRRKLDSDIVNRAFSLFFMGFAIVLLGGFLLQITDAFPLIDTLFEAFSAFGTVGVSAGITPFVSCGGQLVLIGLMFFGRIGIVSIMYAIMISANSQKQIISYPRFQMPVG